MRYCKYCNKELVHGQTKYCSKAHWLKYEKENTHTGRISNGQKLSLKDRKPLGRTEEGTLIK